MRLHMFEWGEANAPPVVCVHGVTAHGRRFKQLAEERWAKRFRVIAVDLRGHGGSAWEPPWTIETHVGDLMETLDALGLARADWVGHSLGGRLVVELAATRPDRTRRVVLLDPAIQLPVELAESAAVSEEREPVWESASACYAGRDDTAGAEESRALADLELQLEPLPGGQVRRRTSQEAVRAIYRELASEPPSADRLSMPVLMLYAPQGGVTTDAQARAYGNAGVIAVPGGHMVMWSAFDQTAEAVERFFVPGAAPSG
jgi:lipase